MTGEPMAAAKIEQLRCQMYGRLENVILLYDNNPIGYLWI